MNDILEFGEFRLDAAEASLTRLGSPVPLPPKVFDLLVYLAGNPGRLIEKEELLKALWPDSFVEESNLTVNIAALRKALGTQADSQPWIETVPKRGYRFLGTIVRPTQGSRLDVEVQPVTSQPRRMWKYTIAGTVLALASLTGFLYFRTSARPGATGGQESIAILPFLELSNATGDGDSHTGIGMTDALITKLGALPQLTVRSLATVRRYEGSSADPLEAGRALRVDTVLTGSVQRIDKRIRVSVRLLRVSDGQSLWADKFDEFFTNVFAVQDAISEKLAKVLALRLTSEEQDQMLRRFTESTEAFRLYELGRYERQIMSRRAVDYLKRAISEDPRYALPWVELADIYVGSSGNGGGSYDRMSPLAREAAATALRLAPNLAEAHAALADCKRFVDRDFKGAERELDVALRLNPRSPKVHDSHGILLAVKGDLTAAINESRTAVSLDPFSLQITDNLAFHLYCDRQYQLALGALDDLAQHDPRPRTDWMRLYLYFKLSRVSEAIVMIEDYLKQGVSNDAMRMTLAHAYALAGRTNEAEAILKAVPENWGYYQRAVVEVTFKQYDAAFAHLEKAVDDHSVWAEWIKVDPDLEPLHADARFAKIVARMGLTP